MVSEFPDPGGKRERPLIAVVDHEAVFIRLMERILEFAGYDSMPCPSSSVAYEEIKRQKPDLVLLDTWLESRDAGWQILQNLWLDEETADLPILICSSDDSPRFEQRAETLRGKKTVLLMKPFDPPMLTDAIARMLGGNFDPIPKTRLTSPK